MSATITCLATRRGQPSQMPYEAHRHDIKAAINALEAQLHQLDGNVWSARLRESIAQNHRQWRDALIAEHAATTAAKTATANRMAQLGALVGRTLGCENYEFPSDGGAA